MIWLSALLVFGSVAVVLRILGTDDAELRFGFEHCCVSPWRSEWRSIA
jgi:hypothetical protein